MLECMQPDDIKTYSEEELLALCEEIRQTIIDRVGINGGHLASNLGAVELSVALSQRQNRVRRRASMLCV